MAASRDVVVLTGGLCFPGRAMAFRAAGLASCVPFRERWDSFYAALAAWAWVAAAVARVTRMGITTQNLPLGWRQIPGDSSSLRQRVLPISKASAR